MHGIFCAAAADSFRSNSAAVGQDCPKSFPVDHARQQGVHGFMVAKIKVQSVCVFSGNNAALIKLHGKSDGGTGRDCVQAQLIADPVGIYDAGYIVHACHAAEAVHGFIFRFGQGAGIRCGPGQFQLAAAHGAAVAVFTPDFPGCAYRGADAVHGIPFAGGGKIICGEDAQTPHGIHDHGRPHLGKGGV